MAGSNTPIPKTRSIRIRTIVIPITGVARICTHAVEYRPQTDSGRRPNVMPGRAMRCVVVTMLSPVRIEDMPRRNTPNTASGTLTVVRML